MIVYGVRDKDYDYCGATSRVDSKIFNDQMRRYLPDTLWVDFTRAVNTDKEHYLGFAIIPPRGAQLAYFIADAPLVDGKRAFLPGESAVRRGDSSIVLARSDALVHQASFAPALASDVFRVDEPFFRIFSLETEHFVQRPALHDKIDAALRDPRTSVTSLVGVGGSGKTTLATAACLDAYTAKRFAFIVSVTAKDRELALEGIRQLTPGLTTYETLLASVADGWDLPI
ncbi:MAG TPA: hypothetical protein VF101_04180 [Gaiellaceae bacterium]